MVFHHVVPKLFFGNPNQKPTKNNHGGSPAQWEVVPNFHRSAELLRPEAALDESSWSSFLGFEESNFSISESFFFFILDTSNTSRFWFSNLIDFDFEAVFCEKSFPFRVEWIFSHSLPWVFCRWILTEVLLASCWRMNIETSFDVRDTRGEGGWKFSQGSYHQSVYPSYHNHLVGGFKYVFFIPTWGNDPIWLIFFKWVETTN